MDIKLRGIVSYQMHSIGHRERPGLEQYLLVASVLQEGVDWGRQCPFGSAYSHTLFTRIPPLHLFTSSQV